MAKFMVVSRAVVQRLIKSLGPDHKLTRAFERNKDNYREILRKHVTEARDVTSTTPVKGEKKKTWNKLPASEKANRLLDVPGADENKVVLPKNLFTRMQYQVAGKSRRDIGEALQAGPDPVGTFMTSGSRQKRKDPETLREESKKLGEFHRAVRQVYLDQQRRITGKKKVPGPAPRQGPPQLIRRERNQ